MPPLAALCAGVCADGAKELAVCFVCKERAVLLGCARAVANLNQRQKLV